MVALPTISKLPVIDLGERAGATPLSPGQAGVVGNITPRPSLGYDVLELKQ